MQEFAKRKAKVVNALRTSGAKGYWQKVLEFTIEDRKKSGNSLNSRDMAKLYARLGERDKAFEFLEKDYEERNSDLLWLKADPVWDNIRSDPRFADLIRRVGLPQ